MATNRVAVGLVACVFAAATATSLSSAASSLNGKITVRSWEKLSATDVTDGEVSGVGHFKTSGAITDAGRVTDYRTVKGSKITIRRVTVGKRGAITFRITIYMGDTLPAPWTIISATRGYKGLHGTGIQVVDNFDGTPATFVLKGTVRP